MKISMLGVFEPMRISVLYQDMKQHIESEDKLTIKEVLIKAGIPTPMVLVCHKNTILPQTTIINSDIELEIIDVGSGG